MLQWPTRLPILHLASVLEKQVPEGLISGSKREGQFDQYLVVVPEGFFALSNLFPTVKLPS